MGRVVRFAVTAIVAGALVLVPGVAGAASAGPAAGSNCVICWPGWS